MDKVINKAKLDELIVLIRAYLSSGGIGGEEMRERCNEIISFAGRNFPYMLRLVDLIHVILGLGGLNHDADNEDIYKVLEVLGWEVKECDT